MREAAPLKPEDPRVLGGYRLTGRQGADERGVVYLGEAPSGEPVVVRTLHGDPVGGTGGAATRAPAVVRQSAVQQVRAARRIDSPWTARILAADLDAEIPYLVSEYVAGPSLEQVVRRHGPRTGSSLHRLATGTIQGLAAVHRAGLVHGDFRPGTVVLGADGPRLVDVALRALAGHGETGVAFQAPEQIAGGETTTAADVFAWAATMVFASCGHPPFGPDGDPDTAARVLRGQPDLGMLAGRLQEIALRCLVKDPRRRPSAADIAAWLQHAGRPAPVAAPHHAGGHRPGSAATPEKGPEVMAHPADSPGPAATDPGPREPAASPAPAPGEPVTPPRPRPLASTGPGVGTGTHDTSGVQVRLRERSAERPVAARRRAARRNSLLAGLVAGVTLVGAVLFVWTKGVAGGPSGDTGDMTRAAPRTGPAVEIATTAGHRYRLAAIGSGQDTAPQGESRRGTRIHADYLLGNLLDKPVPLDLYTVDVFVRRDLLPRRARGLCMWHNGVPEDMCTPPAKPQMMSWVSGGPPVSGSGGGQYMAPGASYVIRVTLDVPLGKEPGPTDLRLYVWKPAYVTNALVQEVPFPQQGRSAAPSGG